MTSTHTVSVPRPTGRDLLRTALLLDAGVTGLNGLAYLAGAGLLDRILGLPTGWLYGAGAFLLAYGVTVGVLATRPRISRPAAWVVVAVNAVWALVSLVVVALGWASPTTVGAVWLVAQALVVGGFAALQVLALRRGR
jgi:hypothetical protein